jgi:hypothetical protein
MPANVNKAARAALAQRIADFLVEYVDMNAEKVYLDALVGDSDSDLTLRILIGVYADMKRYRG